MFITLMEALSQGALGVVIVGVALAFMILALVKMHSGWMIAAAVLTIPYTYTAGDWSGILLLVRLLPLTQFLTAYIIDREEAFLARIFSVPAILMLAYSFYDIIASQSGFQMIEFLAR